MVDECAYMSKDMLRLLYVIGLYTSGANRPWLKDFNISVIVNLGVTAGVFGQYDLAPSLTNFRGTKMFARISQEAIGDVELLFSRGYIDRMLLNTRYYAPTAATRISEKGIDLIEKKNCVSAEDKIALDRILRCGSCKKLLDFAVGRESFPIERLMISKVCDCFSNGKHRSEDFWCCRKAQKGQIIEGFFSIGDIEYKSTPYFLGERYGR